MLITSVPHRTRTLPTKTHTQTQPLCDGLIPKSPLLDTAHSNLPTTHAYHSEPEGILLTFAANVSNSLVKNGLQVLTHQGSSGDVQTMGLPIQAYPGP